MSSVQAPGPGAASFPAAELDRRFYAFVVDRIIAWGIYAGVGYLAWQQFFDQDKTAAGVGVCVAAVVVVSVLFALALGLAGVSPGKALVGLRVVRQGSGRPIGVLAALLRTLVLGVAAIPTLGLGLATLAFTAVVDPGGWRRGAHDKLAHAVVVDVRPAPVITEVEEAKPRQIVNLTAMRLLPAVAPLPPAPAPAPARVTSPPSATPSATPSAPTPVPGPTPTVSTSAPAAPPAEPVTPPARPATPTPRPVVPPAEQPLASSAPPPVARPDSRPTTPPPTAGSAPADPTRRRDEPSAAQWRVSFDTGETFVVEGLALVGRRPEARPGEPVRHLVPLRSTDMSLSKTHAQFQVVPDGALVIMDRGSTNGSFVVRGGVSKALTAGRPATLLDGDTVRLGDRTMTVAKVVQEAI